MVLYTPLSMDDIYPSTTNQHKVVSYQGKTVLAQETDLQELQLVQLISTDPQDYLSQSFTPGTVIKNESIQEQK